MTAVALGAMDRKGSLILRVMRLTKPLPSARPGLCAGAAAAAADVLSHDALLRCAPPWEGEGVPCGVGATTILPSSFGSIFASETFRCFLAIYNCSTSVATRVGVSVELDSSAAARRVLLDTRTEPREELNASECASHVVSAHLPETGLHVLKCSASYVDANRQLHTFRQFYRFNVLAPLEPAVSVIPLGIEEHRVRFIVELKLLNATPMPIYVDKAQFHAYQHYEVIPLLADFSEKEVPSEHDSDDEDEHFDQLPPARRASIAAGDSRSLLYLISRPSVDADDTTRSPVSNIISRTSSTSSLRSERGPADALRARALALHASSTVGRGDSGSSSRRRREIGPISVNWRSSLGEVGHMNNLSVAYEPRRKHVDVELNIIAVPASIRVQRPFAATCCVRNNSDSIRRLYVQVRRDLVGEIVPLGVSGVALQELPPGKSAQCTLTLLPLRSGQHAISGVRVFDMVSKKSYSAEPPVVSVL